MYEKNCIKSMCNYIRGSATTSSAFAYTMEPDGFSITPNEETRLFWEEFKYPLNDQKIYEHSADNWNFCAEFHDGLLLIHDGASTPSDYLGYYDNFVDKNGTIHNLNQGRYNMMYSNRYTYRCCNAVKRSSFRAKKRCRICGYKRQRGNTH